MSALADRIRGIVNSSAATRPTPLDHAPPGARSVSGGPVDAAEVLGGEWRDGCLVVERQWSPSARHGRESVRDIVERLEACESDAPYFAGGAPARAPFLFFDLETTGLSGGAGTQVFLIGAGWFGGGGFVTRQFLMTRFADERPMLHTVADHCRRAGALVSFNGKAFDAPLLETRYLFHRLEWFGGELPHIDVLHPARQFWKREDCSLQALERHLLDHRRIGDVPGFEIPRRYFQFVRSGDAGPLSDVLEHNRLDLLSLAALASRLLHLARSGPGAVRDAREALALGHVYARAGIDARARDAYARSIALSRSPRGAFDATKIEALRALAVAWRRARRFDDAAGCWRELLGIRGCPAAVVREAAEALAIHSEHRLRDFAGAKAYVSDRYEVWPAGRKREAAAYRLQRLDRKLRRAVTAPATPLLLD